MKKFLSAFLVTVLMVTMWVTPVHCVPTTISVYVTVTDITDVENPFNVLSDRQKVTVPYTDLSQESLYVFNPNGLQIEHSLISEEKITYLHAIYQLHKAVFGDDIVGKLYMDGNGDITLFYGKLVSTILYQNSRGIFDNPQNIELADGDEINICLYNYGHTQSVAAFQELAVTVQRNELLQLHLNEYREDEDEIPLADKELTDGEGNYLLDSNGKIVTTDRNGVASISFADGGLHRISILPTIAYYLDTGEEDSTETEPSVNLRGGRKVEVAQKSETRTVTWDNSYAVWGNLLDDTAENYIDDQEAQAVLLAFYNEIGEEPDPSVPVLLCSWEDETETMLSPQSKMVVRSTFTNEIAHYPVVTYDEPQPMIEYTMPWANVFVDTEFVYSAEALVNKQDKYEAIYVTLQNSDTLEKDGVMPCIRVAKYDQDGRFEGFVGDRHYTYTNEAGDIFDVKGDEVKVTATNCEAGTVLTVLVYDAQTVNSGEPLTDQNVVYMDQYEIPENMNQRFSFTLRDFMEENNYRVVLRKNNATTYKDIHIFHNSATWSDMSFVLPKTISQSQGIVAFMFDAYPEHLDDDPNNDFTYKIISGGYDATAFTMEPAVKAVSPSTYSVAAKSESR